MKTLTKKIKRNNITGLMLVAGLMTIAMIQGCVAYVPATATRTTTVVTHEVAPPPWAPPYDDVQDVRYYYIPDIEMYYDVWNHNYIYNYGGRWVFTTTYPSQYSYYDINTSFVVVLNRSTIDPWNRHVVYEKQYPRNYYQHDERFRRYESNDRRYDRYETERGGYRGFNENAKAPLYRNPNPTNLGSSRNGTSPTPSYRREDTRNNQTRTESSVIKREDRNDNNRRNDNNSNNHNFNTNQPSRRDNNNNNVNRQNDNNQNTNRNSNVTPSTNNSNNSVGSPNTDSRRETNVNNNSPARNVEVNQRSQPATERKEVKTESRSRRNAQPAKEETKSAEKDKSQSGDANSNSSRRRR